MIQTPKQEADHLIDRKHSLVEMSTSAATAGLCVGVFAQVGQAVMSLPTEIINDVALGGWTTFIGGALTALAQRRQLSDLEYEFINKYGTDQEVIQGQQLHAAHNKASVTGAAGYGVIAAGLAAASHFPKAIGTPSMQAVGALAVVSASVAVAYPLVASMIKHRRSRQSLVDQVVKQGHGSDMPTKRAPKV